MSSTRSRSHKTDISGKLRIGDQWNAITIIAHSQNNPLKAVAEFVENSIDAGARHITITRGKEKGRPYLRIKDDGEGIRRDEQGIPDFSYVATHICDSIKRQLKRQGASGLQGEFGIGLLSFWTVGEELYLSSAGQDGHTYRMRMRKGDPGFQVTQHRTLLADGGTELLIRDILPGIKQFSGEKIQWYLASELRDRIRNSGVKIKVVDRTARAEFSVEPRQFEGRLLHEISQMISAGQAKDVYLELYFNRQDPSHRVGLYRLGTRVMDDISHLAPFEKAPWTSGHLQGMVDVSYLNLTPGTRTGVLHDAALDRLARDLEAVGDKLNQLIAEQRRAEEERASRDVLKSIQKALKEALLALPAAEYDWFEIHAGEGKRKASKSARDTPHDDAWVAEEATDPDGAPDSGQKQFFEFAGPLFSVRITPASSVVPVESQKTFRAVPRDRSRHLVEDDLTFHWAITEGEGTLRNDQSEMATLEAPKEPGLVKIKTVVRQGSMECEAEALVTVVKSLLPDQNRPKEKTNQGIPSYTFRKAAGELWRSKFDPEQNVIVVNNGHRDFVYASKTKSMKLRYLCRLFAKELVLRNFLGSPPEELLERLIELTLYTEENLK